MKVFEKVLTALLFFTVLGALAFSQNNVYTRRNAMISHDRIFLLPRKQVLRVMALGHEMTVADLLWIRAVQFFGGNFSTLTREGFEYKGEGIHKLFYILQYLDPKFYQIYEFGAFVFTEGLNEPKEAVDFLRLGSEVYPEDWKLLFEAAFVAFYYMENNELALEMAELAGARSSAPPHVKRFKGQILSRLGRFDASIDYFRRLIEESQSELQKKIAQQNLDRILNEKNLFVLTEIVGKYKQQFGEPPGEIEDLVRRGLIAHLPEDPLTGGDYYYNPMSGEVVAYNQALAEQQEFIQGLQSLVERYTEESGVPPESLDDLLLPGYLPELPREPLGGSFALDPQTHQVYVIPLE